MDVIRFLLITTWLVMMVIRIFVAMFRYIVKSVQEYRMRDTKPKRKEKPKR